MPNQNRKNEIKIRKPVPKKPNLVIRNKKDKMRKRRVKHKDLLEEIDN